jgi:hypothetical protein
MNIKYIAEPFTARLIGSTYMCSTGWQVTAIDAQTGKRRCVFKTDRGRSPCRKFGWVACHYKSGRNKADEITYQNMKNKAVQYAIELNSNSSLDY